MTPVTISDQDFQQLLSRRARYLLSVALYMPRNRQYHGVLTRPLLGRLMLQSIEIEELLDSYGARNNRSWRAFRSLVATLKLYSSVSYELLHIQHAAPSYRLLPVERDFRQATEDAMVFASDVLLKAGAALLEEARRLHLEIPPDETERGTYDETLPPGRLPNNVETRSVGNVYETITLLATAFLNLAHRSEVLARISMPEDEQCPTYTSDTVNEETLRQLTEEFHNLQSLYDTYVSDTDVETLDADLSVLRGHISVVMHLLSSATALAHYFERHLRGCNGSASQATVLVSPRDLLDVLIRYGIGFARAYITRAKDLCQAMLKRYTEVDEIEVSIPVYRGFHVRPSTLVASIVMHYGTDVQLELDTEQVNAGSPMEIFRINEKINAEKRRWLTRQVCQMDVIHDDVAPEEVVEALRQAILTLAGKGLIVIYEQPLELSDKAGTEEDIMLRRLTAEISRLLAEGKIDIRADLKVRFTGDKRVLRDIRLLAENGYGEDRFGNNIPLPAELSYLRR